MRHLRSFEVFHKSLYIHSQVYRRALSIGCSGSCNKFIGSSNTSSGIANCTNGSIASSIVGAFVAVIAAVVLVLAA